MNIFYLDHDIEKNVQYHIDKHVCKMPIEVAQMICTALRLNGYLAPYKITHKNHPTCKWVRSSITNFYYSIYYGLALCKEYTYRYGKKHASEDIIKWCLLIASNCDVLLYPVSFRDPPQAMPEIYKCNDTIKAYRDYYNGEKHYDKSGHNMFKWTNREVPDWIKL